VQTVQLLSDTEVYTIKQAASEEDPVGETKMFELLKTGQPAAAARGLEDRMCIQAVRDRWGRAWVYIE